MLLLLDVGNTNVTCVTFSEADSPENGWRVASQPIRTADEYGHAIRHNNPPFTRSTWQLSRLRPSLREYRS